MNDIDATVRTLAAIAAAEKMLANAKSAAKAELSAALKRGTVYAHTSTGEELGYATVPKPSKPKPKVLVTEESEAFAWMVEEFGPDMVETRTQLTERGWRSLERYVESMVALADPFDPTLPPGVAVIVPPAKDPVPRFTPAKNVVELVQEMARTGQLSWTDVLTLGSGESA